MLRQQRFETDDAASSGLGAKVSALIATYPVFAAVLAGFARRARGPEQPLWCCAGYWLPIWLHWLPGVLKRCRITGITPIRHGRA
jgi:hypothetical protein